MNLHISILAFHFRFAWTDISRKLFDIIIFVSGNNDIYRLQVTKFHSVVL